MRRFSCLKFKGVIAPCLALLLTPALHADEEGMVEETMTVVGTRTERSINDVAATITVIDRDEMERQIIRDINDLVRYEPGVSVGGTGSRFGLDGFTIRGIGGNRVLTIVDGVRAPEEFSFGPFLSSRRDYLDVDTLARAEIARGPISTLYGSDALGGVVAFTTLHPENLVSDDEPIYAEAKAGYDSADEGWVGTFTSALGNDRIGGLLSYTRRESDELDNQGDVGGIGPDREKPDPQDNELNNVLSKGFIKLGDAHTLTAQYTYYDTSTDTQILSDYADGFTRDADDDRNRDRYSLEYRFEGEGLIDSATVLAYYQDSTTEQVTNEDRTTTLRQRSSKFEQEITGITFQVGSDFDIAQTSHYVTFGGEYYETENSSVRNGFTEDATTGAPIREFFPFPTRDFPETDVEHTSLFLQDEIVLFNDRLRLAPGVRWDDFKSNVQPDDIYENGNPGVATPVDYDDSEVTWKLGAVFAVTETLTTYARYSEGFRAPPYDDVNVGFTNFIGGYQTIPNADLQSETSEGWEFGARFAGAWGSAELTYFTTDYDNFIDELSFVGADPVTGLTTFQSINRAEVEVDGWEARGTLQLGELMAPLAGFSLNAALAYADGDDTDADVPINSIEPFTSVVGLRWSPDNQPLDLEMIWTWVDNKDEDDIDPNTERLATGFYHLFDLLARYRMMDRVELDVGIFNITDETYIRWADTAAIGADDAIDRFTQPGRNVSATLRVSL